MHKKDDITRAILGPKSQTYKALKDQGRSEDFFVSQ